MKFLVVLALVGFAAAQTTTNNNNRFQGQYVWDLLKPALTAGEVENLLASRDASYPTYSEIPQTNFACGTRNGFYADIDAQCQVFHRCDINGNMTSYLCVNSTVFNQITLICDAWYNVDCARSTEFETYANSRLYTDLPLFDTPPADYLTPAQRSAQQAAEVQAAGGQVGGQAGGQVGGQAGGQVGGQTGGQVGGQAGQQQVRPQVSANRNQIKIRPAGGQLRVTQTNRFQSRNTDINAQQGQQQGQAQAGQTQSAVDQNQSQETQQ